MKRVEEREEYREGYSAFLDGVEDTDCIYRTNKQPTRYGWWLFGWYDAQSVRINLRRTVS